MFKLPYRSVIIGPNSFAECRTLVEMQKKIFCSENFCIPVYVKGVHRGWGGGGESKFVIKFYIQRMSLPTYLHSYPSKSKTLLFSSLGWTSFLQGLGQNFSGETFEFVH